MFYANSWNLYALAKENKIIGSKKLTQLNKYQTPFNCVLIQGLIISLLLFVAFKSPLTLMTMSGFGVVIAYILSSITYFFVDINKSKIFLGISALVASCILLGLCFNDLINDGIQYFVPFVLLLFSGFLIYKR